MDKTRLFAAGAVLIAIALLFALSFNFLDRTGLFGLAKDQEANQTAAQEAEEESDEIKAGLSFTIVEPTILEGSILSGQNLQQCPVETETEILVKNVGSSAAEKVFLEFGQGIRVLGCSNCLLDKLEPEQEESAKARLCLENASTRIMTIGSANSNLIEIGFE